jgi:hypothetical protein
VLFGLLGAPFSIRASKSQVDRPTETRLGVSRSLGLKSFFFFFFLFLFGSKNLRIPIPVLCATKTGINNNQKGAMRRHHVSGTTQTPVDHRVQASLGRSYPIPSA